MQVLIGSDPELFVRYKGEFISAEGLCEGTKAKPTPVPFGAVQVDGMALEYNTDPVSTLEEWEEAHRKVQEGMSQFLSEGMELVATPTAHFSKKVLQSASEEALELGCMPDFNAYTGMMNTPPDGDVHFRTGAGHVHVGWTEGADCNDPIHIADCEAVVRALDAYLGLPSLLYDDDNERRELYGKAGAYRPKPYGVEYRVLSNFWTQDQALRAWVFNNTLAAISALSSGYFQKIMEEKASIAEDIPKFINGDIPAWMINSDEIEYICEQIGVNCKV